MKKIITALMAATVLLSAAKLPALTAFAESNTYTFEQLIAENKVKIMGRHTEGLATAYWSGNAVEMNVEATGKQLEVQVVTNEPRVYFEAFVDGYSIGRAASAATPTVGKLVFKGLTAGKHNIRIVRETGTDKSGTADTRFESITIEGTVLEAPPQKDLYVEIIGDSISCGLGSLGTYVQGQAWDVSDHSATHSYSYYVARELDADYSIVASGGLGLFEKSFGKQEKTEGVTTNIQQLYEYTNGVSDFGNEQARYNFARKPDFIILRIGANDDTEHENEWRKQLVAFIERIKELNGEVPILYSGDVANAHYMTVKSVSKRELKDYPLYLKSFKIGGSGSAALKTQSAGHPNAREQMALADALLERITANGLDVPAAEKKAAEDTAEKPEKSGIAKYAIAAGAAAAAAAVILTVVISVRKKKKRVSAAGGTENEKAEKEDNGK